MTDIQMISRELVGLRFQLDTNRINSRGSLENMNRLERWHERGIISIFSSDTMVREATADGDALRREKAWSYVFTGTTEDISEDQVIWRRVEGILFPGRAKSNSETNDVSIVLHAHKNEMILVTNDGGSKRQPGGILGNRDRLRQLGINVMSDDEAVELVIEKLGERDEIARRIAEMGAPLPDWVGQDY